MEKKFCVLCETSEKPKLNLASIPKRIIAIALDGVLVQLFTIPCLIIIAVAVDYINYALFPRGSSNFLANISINGLEYLSVMFFIALVPALYFGFCESSAWQATPGKRFMQLKITDTNGKKISFWQATWRIVLAQIFIGLFFGIPILCALSFYGYLGIFLPNWIWQEVSLIQAIIVFVCLAAVFFTKNKQTLLDVATKRVVVDAREIIEKDKIIESRNKASLSKELSGLKGRKRKFTPALATILFLTVPMFTSLCAYGYVNYVEPILNPEKARELELRKRDLKTKMSTKGKVVYCIKEIPRGGTIYREFLEEKEIEQSKIPQNSLINVENADGRRAKYGIAPGQIVSVHDIAPGKSFYAIDVQLDKDSFHKYKELTIGEKEDLAGKWIKERLNKDLANGDSK